MRNNTSKEIQPKSRIQNFFENVFYIAIAAGLAVIVQTFLIRPFIVNGASMDPTFKTNDYLIVDEVSYRFHEPNRGDVVVFKSPPEPQKYYIKRVIGLPGDTVSINGTKVTISNKENPDGFTLDEPYVTHPHLDKLKVVIPVDQYFVMGDNRAGSYDSRSWGTVPIQNFRGRAVLRLLPISEINFLPGKATYEKNG